MVIMEMHPTRKKLITGAAWAGAVIWALLIIVISLLPRRVFITLVDAVAGGIIWLVHTIFDISLNPTTRLNIFNAAFLVLPFLGFCVLSLFFWYLLRTMGFNPKRAVILSLSLIAFAAVLFELLQFFSGEYMPKVSHCLLNIAGGASALAFTISVYRFPMIFNRETVSYVVFGALTTVVNMVVYGLCYNYLGFHNLISNTVAWVAAVLFAYVVNKLFVFRSRTGSAYQVLREFSLFVGARLFSFGVDQLFMWVLVDILRLNGGFSKAGVNVVVLLMNYFFSKMVIFKKPDKDKQE